MMKKFKLLYMLIFVAGVSLSTTACVTNQKTDAIYQAYASDAKEDSTDAANEAINIAKNQLREEALFLLTALDNRTKQIQKVIKSKGDRPEDNFDLIVQYAKERDVIKSQLFAKAEKYSVWVNKIRNAGRAVEGLASMQSAANNAQRNIIIGFLKEDAPMIASKINYDLGNINPTFLAILSELFGEQSFVLINQDGENPSAATE